MHGASAVLIDGETMNLSGAVKKISDAVRERLETQARRAESEDLQHRMLAYRSMVKEEALAMSKRVNAFTKLRDHGIDESEARRQSGLHKGIVSPNSLKELNALQRENTLELLTTVEQHIDKAGACLSDSDCPRSGALSQLEQASTTCEQLRELLNGSEVA